MKTKVKKRVDKRREKTWYEEMLNGTHEMVSEAEKAFYRKRGLPMPIDRSGYSMIRGLNG